MGWKQIQGRWRWIFQILEKKEIGKDKIWERLIIFFDTKFDAGWKLEFGLKNFDRFGKEQKFRLD